MRHVESRLPLIAGLAAALVLLTGCAPSGPAPSPSPSASPTAEEQTVPLTLYYVALEDDGVSGEPIGCGDSLVAITTEPVTTSDVLRSSIERLLADTSRDLGESGLTTALADGTLGYVSGSVSGGVVTVELTGLPAPAGECDDPRIEAQLERTAMAATGASEARILVDGTPLEDVLSLR